MKPLKTYLEENHTPQTVDSYLYSIEHFLKMHGNASIYTYKDLVKYRKQLVDENSPSYAQKILACVKRYYDYLLATGQRDDHPCKNMHIKGAKSHHIQLQDLFSSEELEELMQREERYEDLKYKNRAVISFLVYQGLTASEVAGLKLRDISLDDATVYVRPSRLYSRTLELHRTQVHTLTRYIYETRVKLLKDYTDKLLIGKLGKPQTIDATNRMIKSMQALFPMRTLNPKTIRQSVISNWLNEKNYPLEQVQRMAGHRYPSTTEKYLRKDSESKRKLINELHPLG